MYNKKCQKINLLNDFNKKRTNLWVWSKNKITLPVDKKYGIISAGHGKKY